ncbi:MAG TPA: protein kinase [Polyangia bacterium]|jgi:serine/threonine protein kinase/tetratricopeptide (TPR) repeat protein
MTEPTTTKGLQAEPAGILPRAFGNFTLLKSIATGARGEVFAALRPVEIERFCALKILDEETVKRPDFVAALRNEATRVVRRIHGNLVQVYDIGLVDRRLFFVSELVEGVDLAALVGELARRRQPFPIDVAVFVAMEVAAALSYLRRLSERNGEGTPLPMGLPLRDVLLSVDGEVKVLHYGATVSALPTDDALRAPESGPTTTGATDAHLLGALLNLLLGTALGQTPAPPPTLARLLERALSPDPKARPADADEVRAALGTILRALKGPGAAPAVGDLVRARGGDALVDRAALAALAKAFDPRRGASPPTWKVITLTHLETGGGARTPRPVLTPVDLGHGEVIPGTRYRILSKIGEGGMGSVYLSEHVDLEKKVALKLLRPDVARDAETLQQFRQEARAASKVGSAYICDVTDFGELADGRVFFVMEYLEGQSLGRVVRQLSRIEPARAIPILRQVAKALGAAHEKGIVHLDVKPDNVMLLAQRKRGDAVKVVDFGIAGLMHQTAEEEEIAGTPEYIAPERASGHGYDNRSDVYALGVMAYEMLGGVVPFHGKNHIATLTMQVKDPPLPLRRQPGGKDVPEELGDLVMRMLSKDPAARPQSMAEVEALLCEAQIALGLKTPWDDLELPAVEEAWRQRLERRMPSAARPRKAIILGASGVAVASLAVALYFVFIRAPDVVVKEVRVELTNTEEAPAVAAALLKADQAARRERYVRPPKDSALFHIEQAEGEARQVGRPSAGARALRRAYASALTVVGNELVKADLRDLAVTKYKEALLFLPDDPDLQAKAELSLEERRRRERRDDKHAAAAPAPAPSPGDDAKEAAARAFLAATHGRLSEARLALKNLATLDSGGAQAARLADALRARAASAWNAGHVDDARPLYALVSELDASDAEARARAKEPPPPATPAVDAGAAQPAVAAGAAPAKAKRRGDERDVDPAAPRDTVASRRASDAGVAAMARGRLTDAEGAFTKAVRADSTNAVAVGGLAEVAFERARYSEALDYARRAARLAPKIPKYLVATGDAYFKLLRYDEALASYDKAATLAPRDAAIKSRLDRVRSKMGAEGAATGRAPAR